MHEVMERAGVAHWYEVWPQAGHHEHWWKQQLPYLLEKLY
jgi:esterase/lipase superfamily enzyme